MSVIEVVVRIDGEAYVSGAIDPSILHSAQRLGGWLKHKITEARRIKSSDDID